MRARQRRGRQIFLQNPTETNKPLVFALLLFLRVLQTNLRRFL